ncbi:MAG: DUF4235 domain-containing protein [Propionibacteriaceae bacterium]|jgi:hypothetical protein|nr:DUF4235 domain-containing protein [Propionibacteriaceae bacterium]
MGTSKKLLWNLYAGGIGAITTVVAAKVVNGVWQAVTGDAPPDPNDPGVPLRRALTWAVASGIGIGLAQLLVNRIAADQWTKAMGTPAPSFRKTTFTV